MKTTRNLGRMVNGVELVLFPAPTHAGYFGVTDPEDIEWMKPRLTPTLGNASTSR